MLRQSTTVVVAFYIVLFSSTFITNKYVLTVERFAYPAIFQCWQVLVAAVGFVIAASCWKWKWHMQCMILTLQYIWKTIPYYTLSIYAGSRALTVLPLSIFLGIHNSLLLVHCGLDLDLGKQSIFFSTNPKDLVAFTSVAVSSIMLVTTVPRVLSFPPKSLQLSALRLMHSTDRSYMLQQGSTSDFFSSALLGSLLLILHPMISSLEVVNLNYIGLAKVIVSAISLLSFGVPAVPQDYLFWTVLSLLAGMFVPKAMASDADRCVLSNIRQSMQHV
ncbi:uncharacterized protein [Dermacentor andersoni]|uniref:uncharacterized protein isoform X9 n=1 Tax=Dermacentor andersoni TaxID=34620 RepID=UPI0024165D7E|nr:uncharacterized protein LOC126544317 isoform X9 [Dermacentor andersoni]